MNTQNLFSKLPMAVKIICFAISAALFVLFSIELFVICGNRINMLIYRETFLTIAFILFLLHIFIDIKVLYGFIFKQRFLLGLFLLVLLVAAKINFSNIAVFNQYVQPGKGNEFISPIFGTPRAIRSDEWGVSTPRTLTYQYCAGEKYNDIIMGTETPNLSATNVLLSPAIIAKPIYIGYLFLSADYALAFQWSGLFILAILMVNEFFLVVTKEKKVISASLSCVIVFSSFFMWWSGVVGIVYGTGATAYIYRFLNTKAFKRRVFYGIVVAILGASFVCDLYPAWLVPSGYIFLSVIIWAFISNFENIKRFIIKDWVVFGLVIALALTIIGLYYINQLDYLNAISSTTYPGAREDFGGFSLNKLWEYPASLLFPFKSGGFAESEHGTFFSFFPLPMLLSVYLLFKSKKKDILSIFLLTVALFLTIYCTVGLPTFLAKITLISNSTIWRAADYLGFIQIVILARVLSEYEENNIVIPKTLGLLVAAALSIFTVLNCLSNFPEPGYMSKLYTVVSILYIFLMAYCLMSEKRDQVRKAALISLAVLNIFSAAFVLPIQKGADPIYSKPVAKEIARITRSSADAKWIAVDQFIEANFYAACGAKVINSNNYIPNITMWKALFPNGEYEEIYNRYAHLIISFTDDTTHLSLNQADLITLYLNYDDIEKLQAEYLVSKREFTSHEQAVIDAEEIYSEDGIFIYRITA